MNTQQPTHCLNWRKTPLALAILVALPGAAVTAGPPPNPAGLEFRVNTHNLSSFTPFPTVAMDAHGDFVVAWQGPYQPPATYADDIYAQRYDAAGVPQGSEFRVNTYTTSYQEYPAVAMDAAGDFVVVWQSGEAFAEYGQDGSFIGIYAQRYNAVGEPQGSEFQVNTNTFNQSYLDLAVAMDAVGDFVVTWQRISQDGSNWVVSAQRYTVNNYNAAFSTPVLSNQHTDRTPVPEGPAGIFSFDAQFCNTSSAYPLTGLASQTVTLTNNNCLINRLYGPLGMPSLNPGVLPCGAGSALDFPAIGNYSDYALAVPECVTVHYQIGLQNRNRFSFFVDVGGM